MTNREELLQQELQLTSAICTTVASPRALTVKLLAEAGEWEQLLALEANPFDYFNQPVDSFRQDYLVSEMLKKSKALPPVADLEADCRRTFYECEERCARTNTRLYGAKHPAWFHDFRKEVRRILGPLNRKALGEILELCGFGPGVTTGVGGVGIVPSQKYDAEMHLTYALVHFLRPLMGETWWRHHRRPHTVVKGNKFATVPKNAKKRRPIAIEPTLNLWFQLGIGRYIVRRLLHFGIDLRDQTRNRHLAALAYKLKLATIDMSSASDLMAKAAVHESCTFEWGHLLDLARSPFTYIDDTFVELAKFSSMGNGFTFPLETVMFWAVVRTVVHPWDLSNATVYGDDIIVPQYAASEVIERLEYLGFKVNRTKTHLAGEFFESCGKDYLRGCPVRPFYLRAEPGQAIPASLQYANALRNWADNGSGFADSRYRHVWEDLVKQVPQPWRSCRIPPSLGDSGIHVAREEANCRNAGSLPRTRWHEGFRVKYVRLVPMSNDRRTFGVLLSALHDGSAEFTKGREPRRGLLRRVRPSWTVTTWQPGLSWV